MRPDGCYNCGIMKELFFLDGKRLEDVPALRALFYGEGVFESFRWKGSPPVFLSMHLERMRKGADFLGIPFPPESQVRSRIEDAAETAPGGDLHVKACLLAQGDALYHSRPLGGSLLVSVRPRLESPDALSLWVCGERRPRQNSLFSHKTLNYLGNIVAKREAVDRGFDEALFLDTDGGVAETSCHNVFWAKGKNLFTPSSECPVLPGVTREIVLRSARRFGYEPVCGNFILEELISSDYAFLTNAVAGIVYVSGVDGDTMSSVPRSYEVMRESLLSEFGW